MIIPAAFQAWRIPIHCHHEESENKSIVSEGILRRIYFKNQIEEFSVLYIHQKMRVSIISKTMNLIRALILYVWPI